MGPACGEIRPWLKKLSASTFHVVNSQFGFGSFRAVVKPASSQHNFVSRSKFARHLMCRFIREPERVAGTVVFRVDDCVNRNFLSKLRASENRAFMSRACENSCVDAEVIRSGLWLSNFPVFLPVSSFFLLIVILVSHFRAFLFRVSWLPHSLRLWLGWL